MATAGVISTTDEILTRDEAAEYLRKRWKQRVSSQTLSLYACRGNGPPYFVTKTKSGAFYQKAELDKWALARLVQGKTQAA